MADKEFKLVSPLIIEKKGGGNLPRYCTQEGVDNKWNISPPLEWHNVPDQAKSLALLVQDIDAVDPRGHLVPVTHWVVVNIPPTLKGLPKGFSGKQDELGDVYSGIEEGLNDWNVKLWNGPKMPNYGDRFEFKLYALDSNKHFDNQVTTEKLMEAIAGHVVGEAVFIATFG
ncbi:hypothetical protein QN277_025196 [Acacia crassicarpa]|uniref:Uncharacterized protein n=1 Tax=Acacia crassicarpa TaxID=499986 RepID=A0AAE1MKB4_9FABA|nr:hypothetical protein QN277_025196 [Acacia crassicarpa]